MRTFYTIFFLVCLSLGSYQSQAQFDSCTSVVLTKSPNYSSYRIITSDGYVLFQSNPIIFVDSICIPTGCYHISFVGDWSNQTLHINVVGEAQYEATLSPYFGVNVACGIPNPTFGCLDPLASNYNLWADIQVPCVYIGCDDPTAYNYNPLVTIPDNSCAYCDSGTVANVYLCTYGYGSNNSLTLLDDSGDTIYQSPVLGDSQIFQSNVCLQNGTCYTAVMENVTDSSDWNNGYFSISDNNNVYVFSGLVGMSYNEIQFSIDGSCGNVFGCTDTSAVNYDALATVDNGSCVYECMGYNLDVIFFNGYYTGAISFTLSDSTGNVVLEPPLAPANVLNHYQLCVAPGCYTVEMTGYDWTSSTIPSYVSFSCNSGLPQSFFASPQNGGLAYYGVNTIGCGTQTITTCSTNLSLVPYDSSHVDNTVYLLYDQDMSDVTYVYWTLGDGNATTADYPIYYYDNPGNYEVCVHINYSSGCVASSCVSFTVDEFNSYFPNGQGLNGFFLRVVSDIAQNVEFETAPAAEITLFPNPCSDQLYISMPNTNELLDSQIEVKGVDGRTVLLNKRVIRNVVSLDTKDLAAGVYFVLMTRKGVVETQRFIKN